VNIRILSTNYYVECSATDQTYPRVPWLPLGATANANFVPKLHGELKDSYVFMIKL